MKPLGWMLANRYILRGKPLRLRGLTVAAVCLWILFGALCAARVYYEHRTRFDPGAIWLEGNLRYAIAGTLGLAELALFFLLLARRYSIFAAISIFGLFLGSAALVVVLSVMSGFEQDLKHKILGANAHILVTAPDQEFTDYAASAARVSAVPGVDSVTPYISNEVMISSQANLAGVILKGVDPASAAAVTDLSKNMEQGSVDNLLHPEKVTAELPPLDPLFAADPELAKHHKPTNQAPNQPGNPPGNPVANQPGNPVANQPGNQVANQLGNQPIHQAANVPAAQAPNQGAAPPTRPRKVLPGVIIGRELAKNLRLFVGDEVNVISPMGDIGPTGPMPRSRSFRVAGIFYSGMYEYDTKYIYLSIPAAQRFLGTGDEVTGVEVRVKDPDHSERVVPGIERALAGTPLHFDVQDWKELNRNLFSALKVEKVAMFVVLCFIILVAGFSIIANGIMLVREKEREIAILKSMGATDGTVLQTFLAMGLVMGATGIGTGIATGIFNCILLARYGVSLDTEVYYIAKLPVQMNAGEIGAVLVAALLIALAATIYPALVAARLRPVEGLRYDHG